VSRIIWSGLKQIILTFFQMREEYDSKRSSHQEAYLGSRPSTDGRWETWAANVGESPYPVEYTLTEVINCIEYHPLNWTEKSWPRPDQMLVSYLPTLAYFLTLSRVFHTFSAFISLSKKFLAFSPLFQFWDCLCLFNIF
jgi:hypothetical protein